MAETMRATVASMLKGIERYNPENITSLEHYVELQARENAYDLEANLSLLKLYQFNPHSYKNDIVCVILLKAITNFPHADFVLCKCLLGQEQMEEDNIKRIMHLHDLLEMCQFNTFWTESVQYTDLTDRIKDFTESIQKYICHVIGITYQHIEKSILVALLGDVDDASLQTWMRKYDWKEVEDDYIFIANQEETIRTKNITEKIEYDAVAGIMAACR